MGSELVWQQALRQAAPEHREPQDGPAQARQAAAPQRASQEPGWEPALQPGPARAEMEQHLPRAPPQELAEPMGEQEQRAQQQKPRAQEPAGQQAQPVARRAPRA